MIGIDTNVFVRFFTKDDLKQARKAHQILQTIENGKEEGFVSNIVICELLWVLRSFYDYSRTQLTEVIDLILNSRGLCFEDQQLLFLAYRQYLGSTLDFPDVLIGEISKTKGCSTTKTFDKKAAKLDTFSLV